MDKTSRTLFGRSAGLGACPVLLFLGLLVGCELTEIAAPQGEDVLVVEAVLRAGGGRQSVMLHRSLEGGVVRGEPGARVWITTPEGREVLLEESSPGLCTENVAPQQTDSLDVQVSCYTTAGSPGFRVLAGGSYELHVETSSGEQVRGRTQVPGRFSFRTPDPGSLRFGVCTLPPNTPLPLVWSRSAGAWSYLSNLEIYGLGEALQATGVDAPDRLELTGLAISETDTTLVLPTEFGVFERGSLDQELLRVLQNGFPAGVRLRLLVSAADRNFVNGVRGGAFNPSGSVRISSVVGDGIGLFGSLLPREILIEVGSYSPYPSCLPG